MCSKAMSLRSRSREYHNIYDDPIRVILRHLSMNIIIVRAGDQKLMIDLEWPNMHVVKVVNRVRACQMPIAISLMLYGH